MPTMNTKPILSHALFSGAGVFGHEGYVQPKSGVSLLRSSGASSSSEDERDTKDSQRNERNSCRGNSKESCCINLMTSRISHTLIKEEGSLVDSDSAWSQVGMNAPLPLAPLSDAQLVTLDHPNFLNEYCRYNLTPAKIPHNPLDDDSDDSLALEKEIAWLVEESKVLLPASAIGTPSENSLQLPMKLDFAWRHGSLELREKIGVAFLSEISALLKKWNGMEGNNVAELTLVDGIKLIKACIGGQPDPWCENISRFRKIACNALQLGFRRSECIERELNEIQCLKWREAVEEVGEPGIDKRSAPKKQHRCRPANDALLRIALGESLVPHSSPQSDAEVASHIPLLLTQLEDEIAWLAEESLILLPRGMIDDHGASSTDSKKIESMVSAGLVTQCDIDWDYITSNASENLKDELVKIGGIKRRPLQRIVRWHQKEVRVAFQKRRSDISLLLLRGYRRNETKLSLPSHELLVETGVYNVWAVRQMRRRHNEMTEDSVSSKDLRLACNARLGDTHHSVQSLKRQKCVRRTSKPLTKSHRASHAIVDKARSSILTAEEEEIAWVSGGRRLIGWA